VKTLRYYTTTEGKKPFYKWYYSLHDQLRNRISQRLTRLSLGNFGDVKSVGEGVHELKIDYGGGYRIYFANDGKDIILLITGGDKDSQQKDIKTAKQYYEDYKKRKK
jgi:putative addiction module killer protein